MKDVQIYEDTKNYTYKLEWGSASQLLETRITANVKLHLVHEDTAQARKMLEVNLEGSHVHPGDLIYDNTDDRGWYTEAVECTMWNDELTPQLARQAPATTQSGGSATSDSTFDVSLEASKDGPSGGVGHSIGESFSVDLTDFTCSDTSYAEYARHLYKLSMTADGSGYSGPRDLINTSVSSGFDQDLRGLPALAKSNLSLLDQAIWIAPANYQGTYNLNVRVHHTVRYVHLDDNSFHWTAKYRSHLFEVLLKIPVNWGLI